jgi:hypothetical protein
MDRRYLGDVVNTPETPGELGGKSTSVHWVFDL